MTDENVVGVPGAIVELTVSSLAGKQMLIMPLTDHTGFTSLSFDIGQVELGSNIVISAQATYDDRTAMTETSFLRWY